MSGRVRLVSANLANRGADPRAFAELVAELSADAVAVQELWPGPAEALAAVLPYGRLDPRRDCMGMGIALARPWPVRRLALPFRDAYVAEIGLESPPGDPEAAPGPAGSTSASVNGNGAGRGASVELVNVHIAAPHVPPLGSAVFRRRGQVRTLTAYLDAHPRPRAVVGDLNATPLWPAYRRLAGRLTDAALEAARRDGARPTRTWGPWPGSPRLLRIDHALVHGVRVLDCRVVPIRGSDHSALVVDLAPAEPPDRGVGDPRTD